jgi:glutathione S-transferase
VSIDDFPHLQKWLDTILARPAVAKGRQIPGTDEPQRQLTKEEEEKIAKATQAWVIQTNAHTATKKE